MPDDLRKHLNPAILRDNAPPTAGKVDPVWGNAQEVPNWTFIDPTTLFGKPVPEREWIVPDWLAPGHVTALYADGGTGKSLLAQQLMTSCATGKGWLGILPTRCKTIGLFCEDDPDELFRRQHRINTAYGIDFDDLEDMTWTSGVGQDNTLAGLSPSGRIEATRGFELFCEVIREHQARVIVIDTAADTFDGDEVVRRQVRRYVGKILGGLALELKAAVLLNCHPSRAGMSTGAHDGASTAWNNTVRSRWTLERPKAEGDEQPDDGERILSRKKSNYASIGDTIKMRWQNGVLVPIGAPGRIAAFAAASGADQVFLALLLQAEATNRPVSLAKAANNFAPTIFARMPDRQGFTKQELSAAMERLLASRTIHNVQYGRPGDFRFRLSTTKEGAADA